MKAFFSKKPVIFSIFLGIIYPLFMVGIYIGTYKQSVHKIDQLDIAFTGNRQVYEGFKNNKDFTFKSSFVDSKNQGEQALQKHQAIMVVDVDKTNHVKYYVNSGSDVFSRQVAEKAADKINDALLPANVRQISHVAAPNIVDINQKNSNINEIMSPFFLTIATFIGALSSGIVIVGVFRAKIMNEKKIWMDYVALQLAFIIISVFSPIVGAVTLQHINNLSAAVTGDLILHGMLFMYVSFLLLHIVFLLLEQYAMAVAVPIMLSQFVTSGSIVPYSTLTPIRKLVTSVFPMYSSVKDVTAIIFGFGDKYSQVPHLIFLGIAYLIIGMIVLHFKNIYWKKEFSFITLK
ncbi:ABC transporter permease [Periweissella ghanensis]|uniref:ABC transporter permease n=1 Tax=Periweissella ghanensis TaxID=467997 RepID=A0ABN8BNY5_9LACO|nr:ABC transporter permease [Periweissella ghanensis]MCM0600601.1 hypothetical protein [Periweissella ghanensis]CAH0418316.1 hypothetical protein WGH24286_00734 [Periweissella ghanensis]